MLAILQHFKILNSEQACASRLLRYVVKLHLRELSYWEETRDSVNQWATSGFIRRDSQRDTRIAKLRKVISALKTYNQASCDYLIYHASTAQQRTQDWKWNDGDASPDSFEQSIFVAQNTFQDLTTPSVRRPAMVLRFQRKVNNLVGSLMSFN